MNRIRFLTSLVLLLAVAGGCQKKEAGSASAGSQTAAPSKDTPAETQSDKPVTAEACAAHSAPVALCFICDASLRDAGRLWCAEHARYEDRCWLCHPELRDANRIYCEEHSLYEDECFLCHPELRSSMDTKPAEDGGLFCTEHGVPEAACGICHPDLAGGLKPGSGLKVRFPSADSAAKAGIETASPKVGSMNEAIDCYAELAFNQNKVARIAVPIAGTIQSVHADLGDAVQKGQVLATVWSAAIGEAISGAVLAAQTVERERTLRTEGVSSERDLQEAEAASLAARQKLKTLGFHEAQIATLATQSAETAVMELRAPFAGELVERNAVVGSLVEAGSPAFTIADRTTMWAMLNIPEALVARASVGQKVELRVDAIPGETFSGMLTWISAEVDDRTRMTQARAEIEDPQRALRARMFARANILIGRHDGAVIVPRSAVQVVENHHFVFVKLADDLYEARAVRLGGSFEESVAIAEGLGADEPVVVAGGFIAKSQFLISKLGAGCTD